MNKNKIKWENVKGIRFKSSKLVFVSEKNRNIGFIKNEMKKKIIKIIIIRSENLS
jgi:hypothetical protein